MTNQRIIGNKLAETFLLFITVISCYYFSLRYVFPGYFSPLIPHHADFYSVPYLTPVVSWDDLLKAQRFVGYFIFAAIGQLGLSGFIVVQIILTLMNLFLTVYLVKEITKIDFCWPLIALYLVNVFSHPAFYFNYTYDNFNTIAYSFLILMMICWYKFKNQPNNSLIINCSILTILCFFSKESYFITILVFWAFQILFSKGKQRNYALVMLGISFVVSAASIIHSQIAGSPWVNLAASEKNPYYVNLSPMSLITTFLFYAKGWVNLWFAGIIALSLVLTFMTKKHWKEFSMFVIMGLSCYVPYSVLPNHRFGCYHWIAVPLSYAVILLAHPKIIEDVFMKFKIAERYRSTFTIGIFCLMLALTLGSLKSYKSKDYRRAQWGLMQEKVNRNILYNLPLLKGIVLPSDNVLVTGLYVPFHPFRSASFIEGYFNRGQVIKFTVAVNNKNEASTSGAIRYVETNAVDLSTYDHVFAFDTNGRLMWWLDKAEISQLNKDDSQTISDIDVILYPDLFSLRSNPQSQTNWYYLLQVGTIYLNNNNLEKAEYYLQKVVQLVNGQNPYPYFYLGNVMERKGQFAEAAKFYEQAVVADELQANKNPAFLESLKRMQLLKMKESTKQ